MDWSTVVSYMPELVRQIKEDYIVKNDVIRDDIFKILEKHGVVVYYPLENEDNCGFHKKRMVNGQMEDFVYINTAKPLPKQVFTAAHELGHIWNVAGKISDMLGGIDVSSSEEQIVNRFAAELLMPGENFKKTFWNHIKETRDDQQGVRTDELVRVMVMLMDDYMVPYESVRKRMIELEIVSEKDAGLLKTSAGNINELIKAFSNDLNTTLDTSTRKKTITGLRDQIEKKSRTAEVSPYLINRLLNDFQIISTSPSESIIELESGEK
jgi:Zn-dependent peptidase ImmA (M78 family)